VTNGSAELAAAVPPWFEPWVVKHDIVEGVARPPATVWIDGTLRLRLVVGEKVHVFSDRPGGQLPQFCPERHIQGKGEFCLGVNPSPPRSRRQAERWWADLESYLQCQSVAEVMGLWPHQHSLDHGDTAWRYHAKALRLAARIGLSDAYLRAFLGEPSWLTGEGVRRLAVPWAKPLHADGPRRRPSIRRQGRHRGQLEELVALEARRRRAVDEFWNEVRVGGVTCCGTMRDCPLRFVADELAGDAPK
jgi:hypothetical protein